MARINWDRAKIYKRPSRKSRAHYTALRAGYQEWRERSQAEYASYLETSWWKNRRKQKLIQAGHKCEKCGSTENLQVHHRNYKRLYREKNRDLLVVCRLCHERIHNIKREYEMTWKMNSYQFRTIK